MSSYETVPKLSALIQRHTQTADEAKALKWAEEIYESFDISRVLEELDRRDRTGHKDIASLTEAVKHLDMAVAKLHEIGWHGGKAIQKLAIDYRAGKGPIAFGVGILEAPRVWSEQVEELSKALKETIGSVDPDALSVNTAFGDGPEFTRNTKKKNKIASRKVAEVCAQTRREISGKEPTVITDPQSGIAYGPFLDFVRDTFSLLGIDDSAEAAARAVRKKPSPRG